MILRSGKKLRLKDSSANNDQTKEDMINNLPDSLLIEILSLLSPYDVKQTRLVSKRWKNLFAFLPNLYFVMRSFYPSMEQVKKVRELVDQTLAIRGDIPIKKLLLKCERKCHFDLLDTFVQFKAVQELELRFLFGLVKFRWALFKSWDSLAGLTLEGKLVLNVPKDKLIFPCLKKLALLSVNYPNCESLANFLSGCPVLEELFLENGMSHLDVTEFKVFSLSLKRLRIVFSSFNEYLRIKVVIDAPNLEYIYIKDNAATHYSFMKPLFLVEADIFHSSKIISELIAFLLSAKILRLDVRLHSALYHLHGLNMPVFPNLVRLVIGLGLEFLLVWLNSMPNLEHITLSYWERFFIAEQDLPERPPACLRFKMKEIVVHNDSFVTQKKFALMRYMLEHSTILEKFRFSACSIDPKRREQLLKFYRGSKRCQIEFV